MPISLRILVTKLALLSSLVLVSTNLSARQYQYSLEATYGYLDIHGSPSDASGERNQLSASAFWEPVVLDGVWPYRRADFYQRISSMTLTTNKVKTEDLAILESGQLLMEEINRYKAIDMFLAHRSLPVWLRAAYATDRKFDKQYQSGLRFKGEAEKAITLVPGVFLDEGISLFGFYRDATYRTYGLGIEVITAFLEEMFFEVQFMFRRETGDNLEVVVVNNILPVLVAEPLDDETWTLNIAFFPEPSFEISLTGEYIYVEVFDENKFETQLSLGWYPNHQWYLEAGYRHFFKDEIFQRRGDLEEDEFSFTLGYQL